LHRRLSEKARTLITLFIESLRGAMTEMDNILIGDDIWAWSRGGEMEKCSH
jgi:hypothetical protein